MGCTYVIQAESGGPVKIGRTDKPVETRLKSLQTGNPEKLRIIYVFNGDWYEKHIHDRFADRRLVGEWFDESVVDDLIGPLRLKYLGWATAA